MCTNSSVAEVNARDRVSRAQSTIREYGTSMIDFTDRMRLLTRFFTRLYSNAWSSSSRSVCRRAEHRFRIAGAECVDVGVSISSAANIATIVVCNRANATWNRVFEPAFANLGNNSRSSSR